MHKTTILFIFSLLMMSTLPTNTLAKGVLLSDFEKGKGNWRDIGGDISITNKNHEVHDGANALKWEYTNKSGDFRLIYNDTIPTLDHKKTEGFSFWAKSDKEGYLALRIDEDDGSAYVHYFLLVADTWQNIAAGFSFLTLTSDTKDENERFNPEQIEKIYLVDPGGAEGKNLGDRTVWIDNFFFPASMKEISKSGQVLIKGKVKSITGEPVSSSEIVVYNYEGGAGWTWDLWPVIARGKTKSDGSFKIDVPYAKNYIVAAYPKYWSEKEGVQLYRYLPQQVFISREGKKSLTHNFTLSPAGNLLLYGFEKDAKRITHKKLKDLGSLGGIFLYVTDMNNKAAYSIYRPVFNSETDGAINESIPNIVIPVKSPLKVELKYWPVGSSRKLSLQADNGGQGFLISAGGGLKKIFLNYEFARSAVLNAEKKLQTVMGSYKLPEEIIQKVQLLSNRLTSISKMDPTPRREISAASLLSDAIDVSEEIVLFKARADIPKVRQGTATILLKNDKGELVKGAKITYRQVSHDFLFGFTQSMGFFLNHKMKPDEMSSRGKKKVFIKMKEAGLNLFKAALFWDEIQLGSGTYQFERWDNLIGLPIAYTQGFNFFGHGIIQGGAPKFIFKKSFEEQLNIIKQHLNTTLDYYEKTYPGAFKIWNIFNEPADSELIGPQGLTSQQVAILMKVITDTVRKKTKKGKLLINHGSLSWDMGVPFQIKNDPKYKESFYYISPLSVIELFNEKKIDYDLIGYEYYNGAHIENTWTKIEDVSVDLSRTSDMLDQLGSYGKPLHITEVSVPGTYGKNWKSGYWRNKWSPKIQAEFLEAFYTLAFSKPYVREVTWWGATDREQWNVEGGLLDDDSNPKPAYNSLKSLISSWTSSGTVYADSTGNANITGFSGRYHLTIENNDNKYSKFIHIKERESKEYHFTIN